eukprot:4072010-Pyramimonas_sp.AAC.1
MAPGATPKPVSRPQEAPEAPNSPPRGPQETPRRPRLTDKPYTKRCVGHERWLKGEPGPWLHAGPLQSAPSEE